VKGLAYRRRTELKRVYLLKSSSEGSDQTKYICQEPSHVIPSTCPHHNTNQESVLRQLRNGERLELIYERLVEGRASLGLTENKWSKAEQGTQR
jgi:hypothetical protein